MGYAGWTFVACFVANSLSTTRVMWWHNLIAFHAALLPVLVWITHLRAGPREKVVRRLMAACGVLAVVILLGMAVASEPYRRGGRKGMRVFVNRDHEMIRDLSLRERTSVKLIPDRSPTARMDNYFWRHYMKRYELPPE